MMKKMVFSFIFIASGLMAGAQTIMDGQVTVSNLSIAQEGNDLQVAMDINVANLHLRTNHEQVLTPVVVATDDSQEKRLPSITIMGYRRYLYNVRNDEVDMNTPYTYRKGKVSDINYSASTPYEDWMDNCRVELINEDCGCRNALVASNQTTVGERAVEVYVPDYVYVSPKAEVKTRSLEGSAYVDFVVNKTDIRPDYHNNRVELGKINATIDSVRADKDVTIDNLWLKGYASPEGSYAHNAELSLGRVNAIKTYVQGLYDFPANKITTANEPENWEGLRRYVERSDLEHKAEILALIDSDKEPDAKEAEIKKTYPQEYKYLLDNCYPYLRRTDYRVNYTVRGFSDVDEIKEILKTNPTKLSLNEMYLVAQTLEPGSEEFNEIFETAVRLYPDDPVANINAANIAMERGDLATARKYLDRAGDSPEAEHARDILSHLEE